MDLKISGKWAILGGSSAGLGFACARALAEEGVNVVLSGRNAERLKASADELRSTTGVQVIGVSGDLTLSDTRAALLAACPEPDILVTNNGGPRPGRLGEANREDWYAAIEGNLLAHLELIKAVIDGMCERRFGRIVNITSAMVTRPAPTMAVSAAVRTALTAASKGLSLDVARYNVTINNILPERIDSGRQQQMAEVAKANEGITYEEARRRQAESIAAKRLGLPEEVGWACAFLCSALAGYISGSNLHLDGGSYPALV